MPERLKFYEWLGWRQEEAGDVQVSEGKVGSSNTSIIETDIELAKGPA
jgi:hypothetical protein